MAPALALAAVWLLATTVGPTSDTSISDLPVYAFYADALWDGLLPYRDFEFEYPPLAAPVLALAWDEWVFGAAMLVAALVAQVATARLAGDARAAWLLVPLPLLAGAIVRTRYDLAPVALAMAGLALVCAARPRAGYAVLGAGAALKLFPALVGAAAVARLGPRGVWAGIAVFAVCTLPFLALGFGDAVVFHLERPVQIESSPATVLWALGDSYVTGTAAHPDRFKSNGLAGGPADLVAALFALASLAAIVLSLRLARDDLVAGALAALLAFVALGKVLSPQFVLWLAPLAALAWLRGHRAAATLVALATALTQVWFPARYFDLVAGDSAVVVLVGVRNALLLTALAVLLAGRARSTPPAAAPSSG
jgi:hypothetical protein